MPAVVSFGALGPELYDGTSGVALFLAELSRATGNAQERRAALGAIRHALSKADAVPPLKRFGLYTGWPGIALAAGRLAQLFGEQELLESAMGLLRRCDAEDVGEDQFDLLSGLAGAVVAALALHPLLEARSVLESAQRWGEQLLKTAVRFRDTCSWGFARERQRRRLTGISHGTTGVASALLELYMATGDEQFRAAAEGAFRYERRWFDDRSGNWPDFRGDTRPATVRSGGISYATFWCHGAPGISLSRLRAAEVLADPELRREADVGAETTLRETELWVNSGMANYSLCHGLAGNAEVLVTAAEKLGGPQEPALGLALEVAALGIAKHLKAGKPWPCGVSGGENHSLMLGLAGIGHFYLRLKDRAVPSVLLLHSQSFSARKAQQA